MSEPALGLELRGVTASYGQARALHDVSLCVRPGEAVALVGPNGAGKTTTLRAISGEVSSVSGEFLMDGRATKRQAHLMARLGVIHVPEGRGLVPSLNVKDNLRLGAVAAGHALTAAALESVLAIFPALVPKLRLRAGNLSGGEQQMVAVARGLVSRPRVLMVDELSLGLAPRIVHEILEALVDAAKTRELGLLLVDQNVTTLGQYVSRMYMLRNGRSVEVNSTSTTALANEAYLGLGTDSAHGN